jgi:two-component sensor histidine kinase
MLSWLLRLASWKLTSGLALFMAASLLVAGLSLAVYNEQFSAAQKMREVSVQAAILSNSVSAALAFDDHQTAREYVSALHANSDVKAAGVYDLQGQLVAGYARSGSVLPTAVEARPPAFVGDDIVVTAPVAQDSQRLGWVYLKVLREPFGRRAERFGGIAVLIVMASLVVAVFGASNTSLYEAHRKLQAEMAERAKAEGALRHSQEKEAQARLAVATAIGNTALRQSEQKLELALQAGRMGNWDLDLLSGQLVASEIFRLNFGIGPDDPFDRYSQLVARVHPEDRDALTGAVDRAIQQGGDLEVEFRTHRPHDEAAWTMIRGRAVYDLDGLPIRLAGVSLDITARKLAEERQRLLLDELNHRVKNTLATVQSIALQTSRNTREPSEFSRAFIARIAALAQAHELLSAASWEGASLADVLGRTLAPHLGGASSRVHISGPPVSLGPNAAVTLNMAFHELATNAAKYGSLSSGAGRIDVTWMLDRASEPVILDITWRETGGPEVHKPTRRGFGSRLIEQGLAREFDGEVYLTFEPSGVTCRMRLPLSTKLRAAA